jgi:hypothetical protein
MDQQKTILVAMGANPIIAASFFSGRAMLAEGSTLMLYGLHRSRENS